MNKIIIICDRCKKSIEGGFIKNEQGNITCTAGYYDVSSGDWKRFAYLNEQYVCDNCMHKDIRYNKIYNLGNE